MAKTGIAAGTAKSVAKPEPKRKRAAAKTTKTKITKIVAAPELIQELTPELTAASALSILLQVMHHSDKDHVRVSAAKLVLARAAEDEAMRKTKPDHQPEREAALHAIAELLDELAAARVASDAGAARLAQGGASQPADAAGALAHLAGASGPGLGQKPDGR